MKKLFLSFIVLFAGLQVMQAQDLKVKEEGKTEFNSHWFMQLQGGVGHTVGRPGFSDLLTPAAAVNLGYKFNKAFALRFGASGLQAKGGWPNDVMYKYNYLQGNVDAMFDLSSILAGWNPRRGMNVYGFIGAGLNYAYDNDDALGLRSRGYKLDYLWDDHKVLPVGRAGLGMNLRLSDRVGLNLEANGNMMSDKFNSKRGGNPDFQLNGLIGLSIALSKTYKKTEPVYYDPEPAPRQEAPKPVVVKEEPKPAPAPVKAEPYRVNVFFDINKADIRESEKPALNSLISYMKENPQNSVLLTGYADKHTGNAKLNSALSKKRSAAVASYLKKNGIAADRITVDAKGDTVQPFSVPEQNRVTVCIVEE